MSFGGGFGGFGSNNQQQNQSTGFGGFGSSTTNNTNTGGFGSNTNTGFGTNTSNTGGGLFGGGANTSGGFGGFGSTNNNAGGFGAAKPAFGGTATTGGGLFGSNNNNTTASTGSAFGGFGSNTTNNQSTGFGASTGGGLFGSSQNKPAFGGTATTTGGGLFGSGNNNTGTGAFGQSTGGFGASTTGFGQQQAQPVNNGTAAVPFAAHTEKDTATSANSHYQSITFMQPYQNFSFEELRVADYNAGRRYGNSNGQAGAFGQSTGFGGFGQTNTASTTGGFGASNTATGGGLFGGGATNNTSSPFGQNQQTNTTTSGFGSGGGGLFGQNKPATTGLFGSTPAASSGTTTGGLFGTSNNTQAGSTFGGFGSANTANTGGGGLFGNTNNNAQQTKPFGGFGATNTATTGGFGATNTGGFGQNNTQSTGTGLFGSSTTNSNPFGGAQQNQQTTSTFGGFGANQNQNQQNNTGSSLFGGFGQNQNQQNQQKPGGLFGSTGTTGGGLFGGNNNQQQQQQQNTGGGLFGNNNTQQQTGGLFGAKPATTGGGLFGNTANNTTNTGGGLFGGNNQNQTQTSSLFGQQNNNQNKSLFGGNTGATGGGGLFGGLGQQNNNAGNSLFGNSQQQQPAGSSLFGNSQQNQQQPQAQSLTASLMQNPYGNDQLFAGLGTPSQSVGPLATPLSGAQKPAKRAQAIPAFKINPSASMRLITPQKRANGYGFSYSNYGTPGSAQSFTPGRAQSLFGSGGLNRPLSKSLSTSNLRGPQALQNQEDSVLSPGAFTPTYRPYSSGNSIRRLKIDRSLRTDLFGAETSERGGKKQVSFDATTVPSNGITGNQTNGSTASPSPGNALVRTESDGPEPSPEELGFLRSSRTTSKESRGNGTNRPELEQVRGNELAIVPEDEQIPASTQSSAPSKQLRKDQHDQEAGEYYMIPSMQQLREMSREQIRNISPFIVGRTGIGKVEFSKVDLSTVPLDQIMGDIVKLNVRSATVYETGVNTPPQGKGLNVPSKITLENSWPRSGGGRLPVHERKGPRYEKHIERLKRVNGTQFIDYNAETGEWTFGVEHFTTYGLDDEDEDETMMDGSEAVAPGTLTPKAATPVGATADDSAQQIDTSVMSPANSDPDDTFDFKKSGRTIPGGFGQQPLFEDEDMTAPVAHEDEISENDIGESMLEDPFNVSGGSQGLMSSPETDDESNQIVGAFPEPSAPPKSILKSAAPLGTPIKETFELNDNWAEQLQRTVSPRKQDRRALREQQSNFFDNGGVNSKTVLGRSANVPAFNTTMDIMNSIWTQPKNASVRGRGQTPGGKGFEFPYQNRTNGDLDTSNMSEADQAFHSSVKPNWTSDGLLVYASAGSSPALANGLLIDAKKSIVAEGKDVRFAQLQAPPDTLSAPLQLQLSADATDISTDTNGIPQTKTKGNAVTFTRLAEAAEGNPSGTKREHEIWKLASILFDPVEVSCKDFVQDVPVSEYSRYEKQIRREAILAFWRDITRPKAMDDVRDASTTEEKAIACLSCGDIEGACSTLVEGKNFHTATIIAQLPLDNKAKDIIKKQIATWRSQNVLSEISPAIRALYEIAAGNASVSEGKTGAAEDRAPTFSISEQSGLSWQQALGLRLWYGDDDITTAVEKYITEVAQGAEKVLPSPKAIVEARQESLSSRQDGLLVLLRLFASLHNSSIAAPSAEELFSPLALTSHPLNARLSWQLATVLSSNKIISSKQLTSNYLDILATSLAHQLEAVSTTDSILTATTISSHLSTPTLRKSAITSLLARRAPLLTTGTHPFATDSSSDVALQYLTSHSIPASWLHTARALLSASIGDFSSQAAHLLLASDVAAAHAVLTHHVGPQAIITRDHDLLRELLGHFPQDAPTSVAGWRTGGGVYFDFIHLCDLTTRRGVDVEQEQATILKRLVGALPGMAAGGAKMGLEERVAVAEMSRVVGEEIRALEGDGAEKRVRRLPVADDGFARQGGKLWGLYGRALRVG
ncbi:Nucleoporin NUP145-like protein [Elsinoe fawcettii]|nr:Nucleoporin NUP145-like protein [Elsinoe fawcettii]